MSAKKRKKTKETPGVEKTPPPAQAPGVEETPPSVQAPRAEETPRRDFLGRLWKILGIVALLEFLGVGLAFLAPKRAAEKEGAFGGVITAGPEERFAPDTVTAFRQGHFYLARLPDGGLLALSRKCTHLGCSVPWVAEEKRFICPCHASVFDIQGNVANPPAPRALDLFPVSLVNGIVKVDTGKPLRRQRFEKSQAVYP
ncbi:MAG TPA: (2Fe-2S)-binding protein [Deltaproteobacteria bacterium]|nr:(2Fe-2S)-binding protein [Deltaproteobacteria bacterium]